MSSLTYDKFEMPKGASRVEAAAYTVALLPFVTVTNPETMRLSTKAAVRYAVKSLCENNFLK